MFALVSVDVSECCTRCLHVAEGIVQLALLLLKDCGDLECGIRCGQG